MKKAILLICFMACASGIFAQASPSIAVGGWREHLSYYSTHAIANVGDRILLAGESSLFFIDKKSNTMERFSKVAGLSDAGVNLLAYDTLTKSIVITYTNSNIDIVQGKNVHNISDIRLKTIEGSKEIYNITFDNGKAYLACGFGILVLDLTRHEIYDTYFIGENSSAIRVNQVAINDTAIFAATSKFGILYAPKNSFALAVSDTWKQFQQIPHIIYDTIIHQTDTIYDTIIDTIMLIADRIFTLSNGNVVAGLRKTDTSNYNIFRFDGISTDTIFKDELIYQIRTSEKKIIKIGWQTITIYDETFTVLNTFTQDTIWNPSYRFDNTILSMEIDDAVMDGNKIWLAHRYLGTIRIDNYNGWREKAYEFSPNGPFSVQAYCVRSGQDGSVYVAPGGYNATYKADVYSFDNEYWYHIVGLELQDSLKGVTDIAIDPRDPSHIMLASYWNGVIEVKNNKIVKIWDETNTNGILQRTYGYRCNKIEYDQYGNLIVN
jgi:hypothetical protein